MAQSTISQRIALEGAEASRAGSLVDYGAQMTTNSTLRVRDVSVAALAAQIDAAETPGRLEIFAGRMPALPETQVRIDPVWGCEVLARLTFARPAFGRPDNGEARARPIAPSQALAAGKASWARISDGAGNPVLDIDVGESGATLNLSILQIAVADFVAIEGLVLRSTALG